MTEPEKDVPLDVPEADALEQATLADPLDDEEVIGALPTEPLEEPDEVVPPASEWDKLEQNIIVVVEEE